MQPYYIPEEEAIVPRLSSNLHGTEYNLVASTLKLDTPTFLVLIEKATKTRRILSISELGEINVLLKNDKALYHLQRFQEEKGDAQRLIHNPVKREDILAPFDQTNPIAPRSWLDLNYPLKVRSNPQVLANRKVAEKNIEWGVPTLRWAQEDYIMDGSIVFYPAGWELYLSGSGQYLGFAQFDDEVAINDLVAQLANPQDLLVSLALLNPESASQLRVKMDADLK